MLNRLRRALAQALRRLADRIHDGPKLKIRIGASVNADMGSVSFKDLGIRL